MNHVLSRKRRSPIGLPLVITILLTLLSSHRPLPAQEQGATIALSERIGPTIDSTTRRYFGLFPSMNRFSSATIVDRAGDTLDVVVKRELGEPDTMIALPRAAVNELRRYLEHYEGLFDGDPIPIDWKAIREFVSPINPFINSPRKLAVRTTSGADIEGAVLYADSRVLVVGPTSVYRYGDPAFMTSVHILAPSEIMEIQDTWGFGVHLLSRIDITVAGNDTLYLREVLPLLEDHTLYSPLPPPEIMREIDRALAGDRAAPRMTLAEIGELTPLKRFHVGAFYGRIGTQTRSYVVVETFNQPEVSLPIGRPITEFWRIGADYSLTRRLRVGAALTGQLDSGHFADSSRDYARYTGTLLEGFLKLVALAAHRYPASPIRRVEFTLGIGPALELMSLDQRIKSPFSERDSVTSVTRTAFGLAGLAELEYYFDPHLTLDIGGHITLFPSVDVERQEIRSLGGGIYSSAVYVLRAHRPYAISPGTIDLLLGVRYHF